MKKVLITALLVTLVFVQARAQEQLTIKQRADRLFERYEYYNSLALYLRLADKDKVPVSVLERIADCYRHMNDYENAEKWYAQVADDPKSAEIDQYYYAETLLRNQKYKEAKKQYKLYFAEKDPEELKLKLFSCDSAQVWEKQPSDYQVKNLGALNTEFSDWGLTLTGSGSWMFVSDRLIDNGNKDGRTGNNWFNLYQTTSGKDIGRVAFKTGNGAPYDGRYHLGPIALNKTADTAYVTVTTDVPAKQLPADQLKSRRSQRLYTRRLQLMLAVKQDKQWVIKGGFAYNNVNRYSVGNAALSGNGRLLYFTSDMPGGEGKTDIWYSEKQADGTWGKPVNCGKNVNTKDEDNFPFVSGDSVLYYSSKGLPGIGGYDIYKVKGSKSAWGAPQNLKYPINTTYDDFYMVTDDGVNGYLSSNRKDGRGSDDIYAFILAPDKKPAEPASADVPKAVAATPVPEKVKEDIVVKTIYYDLDKWRIRPDAAAELDKLAMLLKQHPELMVQLSSFTDARASYQYNLVLSQRRALAAIAYLEKKGIPPARLTGKGFGETNPVNQCADHVDCTEAEHQLNRRTEFRMVKR